MQVISRLWLFSMLLLSLALASSSGAQVVQIDDIIKAVQEGKEPERARELRLLYFKKIATFVRDNKVSSPEQRAAFFHAWGSLHYLLSSALVDKMEEIEAELSNDESTAPVLIDPNEVTMMDVERETVDRLHLVCERMGAHPLLLLDRLKLSRDEALESAFEKQVKLAATSAHAAKLSRVEVLEVCSLVWKLWVYDYYLNSPLIPRSYSYVLEQPYNVDLNVLASPQSWDVFKQVYGAGLCVRCQLKRMPWLKACEEMMYRPQILTFMLGRLDRNCVLHVLPRDVARLIVGWVAPLLSAESVYVRGTAS
jgi:hypothetical protein